MELNDGGTTADATPVEKDGRKHGGNLCGKLSMFCEMSSRIFTNRKLRNISQIRGRYVMNILKLSTIDLETL